MQSLFSDIFWNRILKVVFFKQKVLRKIGICLDLRCKALQVCVGSNLIREHIYTLKGPIVQGTHV